MLAWLREAADLRSVTAPEYLRGLILELFTLRDQLGLRGTIRGGTPTAHLDPMSDRLQTSEITQESGRAIQPSQPSEIVESGSARFKGVQPYGKRFAAWIWDRERKRNVRLGVFNTPEEAARAYDIAAHAKYGASANFPDDRDQLVAAAQPFLDKLAAGGLTDEEWGVWSGAPRPPTPQEPPLPYSEPDRPPVPPPDDPSRAPLVVGTPITIKRRLPRDK